ncbi:hypothetical protein B0T26DRAFT_179010 [Lasiosphaeria miniovina]|uniref:Uncharacterized protein n=1 Tax=Lasiosphaeria miniovina TaxID=1954250 RepID=A0AA40B6Q3_9PEZI|nr:uncharacterized protein B0T26DRAFT_179010 [Lasiosphaeria miniovina]KAK0728619.1 hypothetical protein B0T26DRAFT_179010 [Lasiosphaeria miniovina]
MGLGKPEIKRREKWENDRKKLRYPMPGFLVLMEKTGDIYTHAHTCAAPSQTEPTRTAINYGQKTAQPITKSQKPVPTVVFQKANNTPSVFFFGSVDLNASRKIDQARPMNSKSK